MCEIVHRSVASCIPDVERQLVLDAVFVFHVDELGVVLHDVCVTFGLPSHRLGREERVDYRCFAHVGVAHEDHFRRLCYGVFRIDWTFWPLRGPLRLYTRTK